jgi:SAM-dependent methyltransferase
VIRDTATSADFEEQYFASAYPDYAAQNPPRKLRFYRQLIEEAVGPAVAPRILDVGCAFGTFLDSLPSHWHRYGTDVSHHAVDRASRRVGEVTFATYDGLHLPFDGQFDVVTALDVLEHVPHVDALLTSIVGALAPGGILLAVVPVYDGPTGPIIRRLDRDPTHVHKRDRGFWLEKLGTSLRVEHWEGMYRYLLPGRHYLHITTRALRRFTPAIAIVARRVDR